MGFTRESKLIDALQETYKEVDSLKEDVNFLRADINSINDKLDIRDVSMGSYISKDSCKDLVHKATRGLKIELSNEMDEKLAGMRDSIERKTEEQINNIIDEIVKRNIQAIEDQILVSVVRKSMGIERS